MAFFMHAVHTKRWLLILAKFLACTEGVFFANPYMLQLSDTDRDFFMTPEEAKEYGIIDEVIRKLSPP
jgi:hypothetical protein